jgi:hypothetical protein
VRNLGGRGYAGRSQQCPFAIMRGRSDRHSSPSSRPRRSP